MPRVIAATGVVFLVASVVVLLSGLAAGNWLVAVDGALLAPTGVIFLLTARRERRIEQRPRRDSAHPMCKDYAHWTAWRERVEGLVPIAAELGYKVSWHPDKYEGQYVLWAYGPTGDIGPSIGDAYDPEFGNLMALRLTRLILEDEA